MSSNNYNSNIKNLKGSLAVEGIYLTDEAMLNLERLASGNASCSQLVEEIKQKYIQEV